MEEEEMRQGRKRRQPLQIDSDSDSESDDESKMVIDTEDEGQSIDSREGRLEEEVDGDEKGNVASVEKCDDNEEEEEDDSDYEDESSELDSEEEEDCEDEAECDIADDYLSKDDLDNESSDDKENDCPICLNRLRNQDTGTPESCDHSFCLECILEWSRNVNTCPVDRQVFRLILARHANREEAFKQIPVEDKSFDDEDEDATYCEVCGSCDREDRLLLCDGCDMGYHCECLDPPVSRIPVEEWFCPTCVERNKIKLAQETSDREKDLRFLAADDLPRLRPRRRQIARTMVSERVRARIQQWREEMARIEDEEENQSASWLTEDEQSLERQPKTKPHASPLKRRKTKKRASKKRRKTKKSSTTEKGASGKKYVKRRRRRRRKYRKKAIRQRLVPLVTTVTSRLVGKLGLVKPPAGTTIPIKKAISKRQSAGGNSSDVSMKPLSIMGDKDDLDPYPNFRSEDPQPGTSFGLSGNGAIRQSKYSASALKSRQPVAKPLQHRFEPSRSIRQVISGINSAGSCDLLSSIMENQSLLAMKSEDVQINRDGSLRAKKPIPKAVVKMEKTGVGLSWSSDEMIKEGDEVSEQSQTRDRLDADTVRNFRDTSSGFSPRSGDSRDLEVIMKEDSLSENTNFSALENSVDQCLKAVNGLAEKSNDDDDSDTDEGAVQSSDEREENTAGKAKNVLGGETEESDKDGESDKEDNSDGSGKEDNSDESSIEEVSDNKDISEESGKEKYGSSRENTSDESEKDAADGESEKDASSEESSKESVENENSKAAESDGDNVEGELAENEDGSKATFETAVIEEVSGEDVDDDDEGSTRVAVEKSKEKFRHCENVGAINKSEDASQHTNKGEEKEQKAFDKSWTGGNKKDEWDIEPECLTEEKIKKDLQNSNRQNSVAMGTLDFLHDKKMCKSNLVQVPSDRGDCKKKMEKREVDGFSYEIESATDEFKMEPDLFGGQMVSEDVSGEPSEESELSSDEKDDKLLDSRPKVPISELPRIPKIRKDTAKVEPVEKGENLSFRSVLERVNIPDSKTAYGLWEKKEGGQRKTRWEQEKDRSRKEKEQKKDADGKDNQLSKDNSRKADGTKIPWAEHGREVDKSYVETKDQTKPKKHENSRERKEYNESKDNAYRHHSPERLKRSRRDRSRSGSRDRDYDKLHKRKERGLSRESSPNRKSQKHQTASRSPVGKEKWKDERKKMEDYPHKRHAEFADYVDLKKSKKPGEEHFSSSKMNWTPNSPQITEYNHMSNSIQSPDRQAKGPEIDPFSRNQNLSPGSEEFSVHNNIGCINDEDDDDGDSEYDPAFPTESGSPLEQDDVVEQDHSVNEFTLMDHGPRLDLRGRDCAPPGQGLLGDRGFLLHGDPGLPGMLQAQNIAFPLGIRMMPPGLQPGIPQHLLMNPMFLNRPPPFARIPRLPVNRLGWPMSPSGMVPIQNRFGARMPAGALPPRPGLLNGGFEPLPPDHGQPLPPLKQHPCDPRHMPSQPPHPVQLGRPSLQGHPPPHLPHPAHMAHPQQLHMTPPALQQAHGLSLTAHMQQQQNVQMGNLPQSLQQPNVQPIHTIQPPHQPHPSSSTQTPPSVRVPPQQPPQQKQTAQILPQKHVPHPSPTLQSSEPVPKLPQPVQPPSITRPAAVQTASGLRLADLTQITKLLEAQAQLAKLAGIDTGSKTMKDDEPIKLSAPCPSSSAKSAPIFKQLHSSLSSKSDNIEVFKIPLPPSAPPDGGTKMKVSGSRSASRRSPDFAESTEVVDMDVASPLDDDVPIELPPSPELEDMDERVAAMDASEIDTTVIELSTHEDVPASAVELCNLTNKEKYLKKLQIQERVVDEVKHAIKPHYSGKKITKDEYKDILRKAVPKICHSKSGNINPAKIKALIEAYVEKARKTRRWLEKKTKVKANGERVKTKASR